MKDGFIRCGAVTTNIRVADTEYNTKKITESIFFAAKNKIKVAVFPELCVTGYTCGDLFLQKTLIDAAKDSLIKITKDTKDLDVTAIVGLPYMS